MSGEIPRKTQYLLEYKPVRMHFVFSRAEQAAVPCWLASVASFPVRTYRRSSLYADDGALFPTKIQLLQPPG